MWFDMHVRSWLSLCCLLSLTMTFWLTVHSAVLAADIEELKKGIVKIIAEVEGKTKVGTGFIVRVEKDAAYIVTAAHVIEGDSQPRVTFFARPAEPFSSKVIGTEGEDPKGLAVVAVQGQLPSGLRALILERAIQISGGEPTMLIGFPSVLGTPWTVTNGSISGLRGRELTFQAPVEEGNSGGPLFVNGKVVGLISEARGKSGYAVPAALVHFVLKSWQIEPQADEIITEDGVRMIVIPAGIFPMGLEQQEVYVDTFYIDMVVASRAGKPITGLNWIGAEKHCRQRRKRLPTEAEWEKAMRGAHAIYDQSRTFVEWVADWYQRDYPEVRPARNPTGPSSGEANDFMREDWELEVERNERRDREMDPRGLSLRSSKPPKPPVDMKKVVRRGLNNREGEFSVYFGNFGRIGFRCALDVPK